MELRAEDKLILAAARLNLSDDDIRCIDELTLLVDDWKYFMSNVAVNNVGPLVYKNFTYIKNYSSIPDETISVLKQAYYISYNRNEAFYRFFHDAVNILSDRGVSVIPLKGIFIAKTIYGDIGLRPMSDMDILIKKEDTEKCINTLCELGYVSREHHKTAFISRFYNRKHLPPMVKGDASIEIHLNAHAEESEWNVNIYDFWKNAVETETCNIKTYALAPVNIIQYLCLHLDGHFYSGRIQLYHYCDIAGALNFYKNEIDWESLEKSCKAYNCSRPVYMHLFLAFKYFSASLPDHVKKRANNFLTHQAEALFIHYLKGEKNKISKAIENTSFAKLKKVKGRGNKFRFLINDVFPSGAFIKRRYKVKYKIFIWLYYLFRIKTGILLLFRYLIQNKKRALFEDS